MSLPPSTRSPWPRRFALAAAMVMLSCASPYSRNTLFGGYNEKRIDDTHYQVRYDGNGNTSADRVWYFWLYRCAELTRERGFAYFTLEKAGNAGWRPDRPAGPGYRLAAYRPGFRRDALRPALRRHDRAPSRLLRVGGAPRMIYVPGGTITTWHCNAVVAMYNDLPARTLAYDAGTILADLGPYVESKGTAPARSRDELLQRAACCLGPTLAVVHLLDSPSRNRLNPVLQPNLPAPGAARTEGSPIL